MRSFRYKTHIPFSAKEVFSWHLRPGAIERLIPPWRNVRFIGIPGRPDQIGSQVVIKLKTFFLWIRAVFQHVGFVQGTQFTDEQVKGPFKSWFHLHKTCPLTEDSSFVEDLIAYDLPWYIPERLVSRQLQKDCSWRHQTIFGDLSLYHRYPSEPLKILVTGSSGLIGKALVPFLRVAGHQVYCLSRRAHEGNTIFWDPDEGKLQIEKLEGFDGVIHLAGESIAGFWTKSKRDRIFRSRCRGTWLLAEALSRVKKPPKVFITASAIGIYGSKGTEVFKETSEPGHGFLAEVCTQWERASSLLEKKGVRVVCARFGMILSSGGGGLPALMTPFRCGVGVRFGSSDRMMSWIAIDDVIGALYHLLITSQTNGAFNIVSPHPVTQKEFSEALSHHLGTYMMATIPGWLLKAVFGKMAEELLLTSQNVASEKLIRSGYAFQYSSLKSALQRVLG